MASMELSRSRFARMSRGQRSNAGPGLLAPTELGIGIGDRVEVSRGDSGRFEGGVRLADETS
jgi:hypothetical protein